MHSQGMVHGDLKGVSPLCSTPLSISNNSSVKANVLIDETGHARLADFSLLAIISDATNLASSSPPARGAMDEPRASLSGDFGFKDSQRTAYSDSYALGMVLYEVLSVRVPFPRYGSPAVIAKCLQR